MDLRTSSEGGLLKIYDRLRKKFVALTPEEYVRQHFVNYMIEHLGFPASRMANEIGVRLNGTQKRCDTVIFGDDTLPLIIVEYKSPKIEITQDVFDQIVRYNMKLHARYLIVSNGLRHYCCINDYANDTYHFLPQIPDYRSLSNPISDN